MLTFIKKTYQLIVVMNNFILALNYFNKLIGLSLVLSCSIKFAAKICGKSFVLYA
jgi:hypothetical protein